MKRKREVEELGVGDRVVVYATIPGFFYSGEEIPNPLLPGQQAKVLNVNGTTIEIKYKDAKGRKAKAITSRKLVALL